MNHTNSSENLVKLIDFSMTRTKDCADEDNKSTDISVRYCAPEILKSIDQSNYSEASDVYSLGVLMWEACSHGKVPYGSDTSNDDIRQRRLSDEQLLQPNDCHTRIWIIIEHCLLRTPEIRDTMKKIQSKFLEIHLEKSEPSHQRRNPRSQRRNREESYRPKTPPINSQPTLLIECRYCSRQFTWNALDPHEVEKR
ncbi:unnamed protein product [Rotaria sp. Silwood1]|nr:unnamed protein product [Rotaria sp. Silwood1]